MVEAFAISGQSFDQYVCGIYDAESFLHPRFGQIPPSHRSTASYNGGTMTQTDVDWLSKYLMSHEGVIEIEKSYGRLGQAHTVQWTNEQRYRFRIEEGVYYDQFIVTDGAHIVIMTK